MSWLNDATVETAEEKAAKKIINDEAAIRSKYSNMLKDIAGPYSAEERETWKTQEQEAIAYKAWSGADCPMITAMAATRNIPLDLLADKILANSVLFRNASGQILGAQQAELDLLYPDKKEEI